MLTRRYTILAKIEPAYGTDPVPAAGDAVSVFDLSVSVEGEKLERQPIGGSLSPVAHAIGQKWAGVKFSVNARGSGSGGTAPEVSALLRSCGLGETLNPGVSVVYAPVSTVFESCTIYAYLDGIIHKITGCRGTVEITCEAGQFARFSFTMTGRYQIPVDGALVSGTYDSTTPPPVSSTGFTAGGYAAVIQSLQVSLNNNVSKLKDVNSAGRVEITGRATSGSIDPEAVTEAARPFWANWANGTQEAMSMTIGSVPGNVIGLNIPKAVYDSVGWGDRDGIRKYELPFVCARNNGNDELTVTFS